MKILGIGFEPRKHGKRSRLMAYKALTETANGYVCRSVHMHKCSKNRPRRRVLEAT
jgi:hypothetical protein